MKTVNTILKVLAILAAIVGVIYVAATYGEKIVAWARDLLAKFRGDNFCCFDEDFYNDTVQAGDADFEA
ncbi:MAG: hypothetical protein IKB80_03720 [Oscillospiraceae bacterium]|nr:hypothetical protein [Oscillospiraceae bacterium]